MSTVNFSVPEEVKRTFNETFAGRNKSAIIAELMMEAVERAHQQERVRHALDRIFDRRRHAPTASRKHIDQARRSDRT